MAEGASRLRKWKDAHPEARPALDRLAAEGLGGTADKWLGGADDAALATFASEVARRDWPWIRAHRAALLKGATAQAPAAADLAPLVPGTLDDDRDALELRGRASLAAGEWGSLVFAGGAATRFYTEARDDPRVRAVVAHHGSEPPKGLFPVTPVAGRSFLQRFAAEALAVAVDAGRMPPFVLMTSRLTHDAIRYFARTEPLQGFPRAALFVLGQTEQPRLDAEGDLLVEADGRLVVTGDGHGGVYKALVTPEGDGRSLADQLRAAGVRHLVLHNVDNAAARPFEPARLGWHLRGGFAFTLTMVPRARLAEKVGLAMMNRRTGRIEVVEYSVCPAEVAEAADAAGTPVYRLAHINTNLVELDAVRADVPPTLYTGKKVTVQGRVVDSSSFEMLNQHLSGLLPAERVGVLLVDRTSYFLPTKTLRGDDSLEQTTAALSAAAARLLRAAGASVDPTAAAEIDPCVGDTAADLGGRGAGAGWEIGPGAAVCLGVRHGADDDAPYGEGLRLGEGARLCLEADLPYGTVRLDRSRAVAVDDGAAGRVRVGRDVTLARGASVSIRVQGDGVAEIPDGARLAGRIEVVVPPGGRVVVGA
jgi:UDP-N-acetylglucosamine/UDP-N-acetylgalactosamine diphosphorylase